MGLDLETVASVRAALRKGPPTSPQEWDDELRYWAVRARYTGKTWLYLQRSQETLERYKRWLSVIYA